MKSAKKQIIFTIGHSNLDLEVLIKLLKDNDIKVLVDIRSNPFARLDKKACFTVPSGYS